MSQSFGLNKSSFLLLGRYGNDWSFLDKPMVITNKEGTGMERRYSYVIIFRQIFYAGKNLKPNVIKKKNSKLYFPKRNFFWKDVWKLCNFKKSKIPLFVTHNWSCWVKRIMIRNCERSHFEDLKFQFKLSNEWTVLQTSENKLKLETKERLFRKKIVIFKVEQKIWDFLTRYLLWNLLTTVRWEVILSENKKSEVFFWCF